ncbi:MAG: hypothetical protein KAZ48_10140 [Candidatus Nanopelagicales bacterium]|jgi:hypothetical protein|nr:hypothetical protein [Candidatus Nanopelagicales bacterium]
MGKLWVRLDTNIHQHDKILHLLSLKDGHRAAAMYMFSLSWSGLAESDGHIPDVALPMIHGTAKHAQMLCQVGLWERNGRGFVIQNWAERQELAAVSDAKHKAKQAAGRKSACRRAGHPDDCECWKDPGSDHESGIPWK